LHICTLKTFGYAYCQIQAINPTYGGLPVSNVYLNPAQTVTITILLTYKIDDGNTIFNSQFCAAGNSLLIYQDSVLIDMTNVFLNPSTLTATYTLPLLYSSVKKNSVFLFKSKDSRDSSAAYVSNTVNVGFGYCLASTLSIGKVTFSNGT
jgi:hypothetical protein